MTVKGVCNMFISAVSSFQNVQNYNNFNFKKTVTEPINAQKSEKSDNSSNASKALQSYFLGGQKVSFGGTSGFKIKKLEGVPCPCCGQIMLTPESTEKHVNRLKLAKGDKLADRLINEEMPILRSNEKTVAWMVANTVKGTEMNISSGVKKANENLPANFNAYCQDVLMNATIIAEENFGENSKVSQYLMKKVEETNDHTSFYRPNITEEFAQFKSEMAPEQYHKLEDTLMGLPLNYKNVARIMDFATQNPPSEIARKLLAPSMATAEHVLPHSLGGSNQASNFLSECAGCNNPRSSMPYAEWFKIHPEFKRNAQGYIEHVEGRIVNGELPTTYDSYPVDIKETLTKESEGQIILKVLDKAKLVELREMKKAGQEINIHEETQKAEEEKEN